MVERKFKPRLGNWAPRLVQCFREPRLLHLIAPQIDRAFLGLVYGPTSRCYSTNTNSTLIHTYTHVAYFSYIPLKLNHFYHMYSIFLCALDLVFLSILLLKMNALELLFSRNFSIWNFGKAIQNEEQAMVRLMGRGGRNPSLHTKVLTGPHA